MSVLQATILGVLQGFAEFLPISSSGHLVLAQHLLNITNGNDFTFDVYVHFGTLLSVVVIFWRDIVDITRAMLRAIVSFRWKEQYDTNEQVRLGFALAVSTIPAGVIGVLFHDAIKEAFNDPKLVAMNLVITGLILFLTKLAKPTEGKKAGIVAGLVVGIAQAVAILPGISRSGSTISTAMYLKISPVQAARFSFLMSIPVIAGAALLETKNLVKHGFDVGIAPLAVGTIVSAIMGYFSIKVLLAVLQRGKLSWFAIYCLTVGVLGILFIS
ncbi:MAG: undecaprenyl-diphosphate phosphatase [Ignavibacteriales bacterium]|nr:undecaprenyl-diphosphate phosphatase [Ignavibacteriales bacterium]